MGEALCPRCWRPMASEGDYEAGRSARPGLCWDDMCSGALADAQAAAAAARRELDATLTALADVMEQALAELAALRAAGVAPVKREARR